MRSTSFSILLSAEGKREKESRGWKLAKHNGPPRFWRTQKGRLKSTSSRREKKKKNHFLFGNLTGSSPTTLLTTLVVAGAWLDEHLLEENCKERWGRGGADRGHEVLRAMTFHAAQPTNITLHCWLFLCCCREKKNLRSTTSDEHCSCQGRKSFTDLEIKQECAISMRKRDRFRFSWHYLQKNTFWVLILRLNELLFEEKVSRNRTISDNLSEACTLRDWVLQKGITIKVKMHLL